MARILIACETSGALRQRFAARGHDVVSCDLLPAQDGGRAGLHHTGDVRPLLDQGWDLMIGHPPCTYLSSSGLHWNHRVPGRAEKTEEALAFFRLLWEAPIARICLENPIGAASRIAKPSQIVQPYQFGDDASKATCLWLKGLPPLQPTEYILPRMVHSPKTGKLMPRWSNQCDSGQNKLGPSPDRWQVRSNTYHGIADAMVAQWDHLL